MYVLDGISVYIIYACKGCVYINLKNKIYISKSTMWQHFKKTSSMFAEAAAIYIDPVIL